MLPGRQFGGSVTVTRNLNPSGALDDEALDLHARVRSGVHVLVLGQLRAPAAVDQELLRHLGRALARDDELAGVGVDDRRDALEDVVVVALVDALLLAGLDRDLVDEGLRADLVRVLVVDRALEEHAAAVGREQHRTAAATAAAASAAAAGATAAAATAAQSPTIEPGLA